MTTPLPTVEIERIVSDDTLRPQLYRSSTHSPEIVTALFEKTPPSHRIKEWGGSLIFAGCMGNKNWHSFPGLHMLAQKTGVPSIADKVFELLASTSRLGNYTSGIYIPQYGTPAQLKILLKKGDLFDLMHFFMLCHPDSASENALAARKLLDFVPKKLWAQWGTNPLLAYIRLRFSIEKKFNDGFEAFSHDKR